MYLLQFCDGWGGKRNDFQPGCAGFNGPVAPSKRQQSEAVIGGVHVIFKDGAGLSETAAVKMLSRVRLFFEMFC